MPVISETVKATMQKASTASNQARRQLIAAHQEEYERLLGDAREAQGLPRVSNSANFEMLRQRKERLEAQLAKISAQLGN